MFLNIQRRMKMHIAEKKALEDGEHDRTLGSAGRHKLLTQLSAKIDELHFLRWQMRGSRDDHDEKSKDYERKIVIEVVERMEEHVQCWNATLRLPDGTWLDSTLSDDMPCTAGQAVESAGRQLDQTMANMWWDRMHKKKDSE